MTITKSMALINLLQACTFGLAASMATAQTLNASVAKVGPVSNVPVALQNLRWHMNDADINALTFQTMERIFTTRKVPNAGVVTPLPKSEKSLNISYAFAGKTYTSDDFLDRTYTNALLIIKDGKIVYENYRNNTNRQTHFMGWSMTKSITSLLIGAAVEEGRIKSLDDNVVDYLPELRDSAYNGVSIRQVLQMRSGVDYAERYDFANPGVAARNHILALVKNVSRFVDMAKTLKRAHPPGEFFQYKTIDTAVLGLLLERVTDGSNVAAYMAQHLWEPLGAESYGFFIMDGEPGIGREFTGAGFNAVLRDYARIGLMMLNGGRVNGKQVIPAYWVKESVKPVGPEKDELDYGYQWWTVAGTKAYSAIGLQGQFIYVDPVSETVVVKVSYFPPGEETEALSSESFAFFDAVSKWKP